MITTCGRIFATLGDIVGDDATSQKAGCSVLVMMIKIPGSGHKMCFMGPLGFGEAMVLKLLYKGLKRFISVKRGRKVCHGNRLKFEQKEMYGNPDRGFGLSDDFLSLNEPPRSSRAP